MIERYKVILGMLLAVCFWGIAFPQYFFTGDCVRIFDENGAELTEDDMEDENLYHEISTAKPEQIEVKISFLEWAKR